jgi:two-component system response regulator MprA
MRVLVVDDDRALRDALRRALTLGGYEVLAAAGGLQAIEQVEGARPDVMVLDLLMPDLDGLEVCRRLRDRGDRTPILMLTARDAVDDRIAGLDAGADDYHVKPFDVVELTRTEYQLLELLMLNPRRVLPHGLIYERVWGYDFGPSSNALRVYVGYLRRKLAELGASDVIHTVRGVGYVLRDSES